MKEVNFEIVKTNGINIRVASMGEGPLVIFCHGWPESGIAIVINFRQ